MLTAALIIAAIFLVACFVGAFIHHGNPIDECPEKVEHPELTLHELRTLRRDGAAFRLN